MHQNPIEGDQECPLSSHLTGSRISSVAALWSTLMCRFYPEAEIAIQVSSSLCDGYGGQMVSALNSDLDASSNSGLCHCFVFFIRCSSDIREFFNYYTKFLSRILMGWISFIQIWKLVTPFSCNSISQWKPCLAKTLEFHSICIHTERSGTWKSFPSNDGGPLLD